MVRSALLVLRSLPNVICPTASSVKRPLPALTSVSPVMVRAPPVVSSMLPLVDNTSPLMSMTRSPAASRLMVPLALRMLSFRRMPPADVLSDTVLVPLAAMAPLTVSAPPACTATAPPPLTRRSITRASFS